MRNAEFALLLVEGVYFRQDIFGQDEQDFRDLQDFVEDAGLHLVDLVNPVNPVYFLPVGAIRWLQAIGSLYITASSIGKKQHTSPLADLAAVRVYISHVKFT
jgi:hypothetical protein